MVVVILLVIVVVAVIVVVYFLFFIFVIPLLLPLLFSFSFNTSNHYYLSQEVSKTAFITHLSTGDQMIYFNIKKNYKYHS